MSAITRFSPATHLFGTMYQFSTDAKDEIIKSFVASEDKNAVCEIEDDYFVLHCHASDNSTPQEFLQHLLHFIKKEQQQSEPDLFEDTRLRPIDGTLFAKDLEEQRQPITQILAEEGGLSEEDAKKNVDENIHKVDTDVPLLIDHEKFTQTWAPPSNEGLVASKSRDESLRHVGTLTNSRLELSELDEVILRSDQQVDIDNAVSKLESIDKMQRTQRDLPHTFSFPIVEGRLSFKLQMTALKTLDIADGRFKSTLLPRTALPIQDVGNALVLSMIQGGKTVVVKQGTPLEISDGVSLWNDQPYMAFCIQSDGDRHGAQLVTQEPVQNDILNPPAIDRWLDEAVESTGNSVKYQSTEIGADTKLTRPLAKRSRVPRGNARTSFLSDETAPAVLLKENQGPSGVHGAASIENVMPPTASTVSLVTSPQTATAAPIISTPNNENPTAEWKQEIIQGLKMGCLIDIEEEPEASNRTAKDLRRTMGQKKPKQRMSSSNTEMLKKYEKASRHLLYLSRQYQGTIRFELVLGKFLTSPKTGSVEFMKPFLLSEWPCGFLDPKDSRRIGHTIFTPRLTTNYHDIHSILNIKQSQGRPMFEEQPFGREMTYQIICKTKSKDQIVIQISEDGSFKVQGECILIGSVDWHYPLRIWDTRLQLTASGWLLSDYHRQAQAIVSNMKIHKLENHQAIFSFSTIDDILSIQTVRIIRETRHSMRVYPDLVYHLREIQDLSVQEIPGANNSYEGWVYTPAEMAGAGKLWWEASVTSIYASALLSENDNLEYGETSNWQPEDITSRGVVRDIYAMADTLVTNTDSVGSHNNLSKAKETSSNAETSSRTKMSLKVEGTEGPPGMVNYW